MPKAPRSARTLDPMKQLPSKAILYPLAAVALFLVVWGYFFELAYFARLGINVHKLLSLKHFVVQSASSVVPMLLALLVFSNAKRFFTKDIHSDPAKETLELLKGATFEKHVVFARHGAAIAIIFLALVIALPEFGIAAPIWHIYLYMVFMVLQSFFGAMLTSPAHARFPVMLVFMLSVAACFAGGGYGYATIPSGATPGTLIRDDFLVTVSVGSDGKAFAEAKQISLPLPPALGFLEKWGEL